MTGKVIVDGPDEIRGPLEKILESERTFERDDRAVTTTLDTRSRFVFEWFFGHNGCMWKSKYGNSYGNSCQVCKFSYEHPRVDVAGQT